MIGAHILKDGTFKHINAIEEHKIRFKSERMGVGKYKIWHNLNSNIYTASVTPYYEAAYGAVPEHYENYCIVEFTEMINGELYPKDIDFDIVIIFPY